MRGASRCRCSQTAGCVKELEEMTAMSSLESESDEESEEDTDTVFPPSEPSHKHKKTGTNVLIPPDFLSRPSVVSLATRLRMSPMQQAAFTRGLVAVSGGECRLSLHLTKQLTEQDAKSWRQSVRNSTSSGHQVNTDAQQCAPGGGASYSGWKCRAAETAWCPGDKN